MAKLQRLKKIWNTIKNGAKKVASAAKKIVTWGLKKSPGLINALVKMIDVGDSFGARKIIINAIPEAGPYINMVIDIFKDMAKSGTINDCIGLIQDLMDKKLSVTDFIAKCKDIIQNKIGDKYKILKPKKELAIEQPAPVVKTVEKPPTFDFEQFKNVNVENGFGEEAAKSETESSDWDNPINL